MTWRALWELPSYPAAGHLSARLPRPQLPPQPARRLGLALAPSPRRSLHLLAFISLNPGFPGGPAAFSLLFRPVWPSRPCLNDAKDRPAGGLNARTLFPPEALLASFPSAFPLPLIIPHSPRAAGLAPNKFSRIACFWLAPCLGAAENPRILFFVLSRPFSPRLP